MARRLGDGTPANRPADYRLRLDQTAYISILPAGLTGAKARYLEIVNPLPVAARSSTPSSRCPDLRDRAQAFSRIVEDIEPSIPYARFSSTPSTPVILASAGFLETVVRELTSAAVERVLPGDGAVSLHVLSALTLPVAGSASMGGHLRGLVKHARMALPTRLVYRLRPGWTGPRSAPSRPGGSQSADQQSDDRTAPGGCERGGCRWLTSSSPAPARAMRPSPRSACGARRCASRRRRCRRESRCCSSRTAWSPSLPTPPPRASSCRGRRRRASPAPRRRGGGLCVGGLFGTPGAWWQVGAEAPEGTYALARWDAGAVELRQRRLRLAHAVVRAHRGRLPRLHLAARPGDAAGQLRARAGGDRLLPLLGHPGAGGLLGRAPAAPAAGRAPHARPRRVAHHAPRGAASS